MSMNREYNFFPDEIVSLNHEMDYSQFEEVDEVIGSEKKLAERSMLNGDEKVINIDSELNECDYWASMDSTINELVFSQEKVMERKGGMEKRLVDAKFYNNLGMVDDKSKQKKTSIKLSPAYKWYEKIKKQYLVRKIGDKIKYYNGMYYDSLTKRKFIELCMDMMKADEKYLINSFQVFDIAYRFFEVEEPETIEIDEELICFKNCIVNIRNLEVYSHDDRYVTTFCINAEYIEDIDKNFLNDKMYYFTRFLSKASGDNRDIELQIWQMLANSMMNVFHFKKFYLLGKAPNSGKSLLGELIRNLIGNQYVSQTPLEKISENFALSQLDERFIIMGLESKVSKLNSNIVVRLKELTGEKEINIEKKGIDKQGLENRVLMIFGTNDELSFANNKVDQALIERMIYIPFDYSCPAEERDQQLIDKFMEEIDAIATYGTYIAHELYNTDFAFCESERSKMIKKEMAFDPIKQFVDDNLEYVKLENAVISTAEIYERYIKETGDDISRGNFTSAIARLLPKCKKERVRIGRINVNAFRYIWWKNEPFENSDLFVKRKMFQSKEQ